MKSSRVYVDPRAKILTPAVQAAAGKAGAVPVVGLAARLLAEHMGFVGPYVITENDDEDARKRNIVRQIDPAEE